MKFLTSRNCKTLSSHCFMYYKTAYCIFQTSNSHRDEFTTFPFNTIGWITAKSKIYDVPKRYGTGFLISNDLVLTSSHNFIVQHSDDEIE